MGSSTIPAASAAGKTRFVTTLTSGTSYTVPAGVTYLNVTLQGGGGGGGGATSSSTTNAWLGQNGLAGQMIISNLATTPGASIAYSIGAGGTGGAYNASGGQGGTTTFTGAISAAGGLPGKAASSAAVGSIGTQAAGYENGGAGGPPYVGSTNNLGGAGGSGQIVIEYWA
jgi:hypothetical protein